MKQIVIVGGGIAGLSAAYFLNKKAQAAGFPARIILLEADSAWGGKIRTDRSSGFVIEGGPDTFLATKPQAVALCKELGLGDRLHGTNPAARSTYVLHKGCLLPLPEGLAMMIPTHFRSMAASRLLSWPQKLRMGLDFLIPPRSIDGDESLGSFISRRLGRGAYENLIEPLMSGIYAGDGDALSLASTFPYLKELEMKHGGLVRGALEMKTKAARAGKSTLGSRSAFLTPTLGLAEIVEALVSYLQNNGVELRLGARVTAISQPSHTYQIQLQGETLTADRVILAAPAYASGAILAAIDSSLAGELAGIPYISTATVSLAYPTHDLPRALNGYGYVIPRRENRRALACTWTSTKFPHRAPDGYALLRVFVGRAGQEEDIAWNEPDLLALARQELEMTLGIRTAPVLSRVFMWEKAMPQYNLGHPERLVRIDTALQRHPALALAGNGYRGIGIPDCIRSGETAANRIVESLFSLQERQVLPAG
jgi:protoporphyrinogen/coproporphyrinogen III oxidase